MIYLGNNIDFLSSLENNTIDLVITSPPYKDVDGYDYYKIKDVFRECFRLLRNNTLLFLNFGHLAEDKFRPFKTCELAMDVGFHLNDTITWVKNHYKPIQGNKRLNNLSEFIFVLYKGKMPKLNRLAVGIPYKDKSNARRFNEGQDLKCAGNVWYIKYPTIQKSEQKLHNDRFPLELPERCIKLCGYNVETVLDPYCGSGTTCLAAKRMGKKYMGAEISPHIHKIAIERLL